MGGASSTGAAGTAGHGIAGGGGSAGAVGRPAATGAVRVVAAAGAGAVGAGGAVAVGVVGAVAAGAAVATDAACVVRPLGSAQPRASGRDPGAANSAAGQSPCRAASTAAFIAPTCCLNVDGGGSTPSATRAGSDPPGTEPHNHR